MVILSGQVRKWVWSSLVLLNIFWQIYNIHKILWECLGGGGGGGEVRLIWGGGGGKEALPPLDKTLVLILSGLQDFLLGKVEAWCLVARLL